jgi:hypothetical protein
MRWILTLLLMFVTCLSSSGVVLTSNSIVEYVANGTATNFTVPYYFVSKTNLFVYTWTNNASAWLLRGLDTHYSVTGENNMAGGTVTFHTAPANGDTVKVERIVPIVQTVDYINSDAFPAETHERVVDLLTMICQQLDQGSAAAAIAAKNAAEEALALIQGLSSTQLTYMASGPSVYVNITGNYTNFFGLVAPTNHRYLLRNGAVGTNIEWGPVPTDGINITLNGENQAILKDMAAYSVKGRSAGTSGQPADISGTPGQILQVGGSGLGFYDSPFPTMTGTGNKIFTGQETVSILNGFYTSVGKTITFSSSFSSSSSYMILATFTDISGFAAGPEIFALYVEKTVASGATLFVRRTHNTGLETFKVDWIAIGN